GHVVDGDVEIGRGAVDVDERGRTAAFGHERPARRARARGDAHGVIDARAPGVRDAHAVAVQFLDGDVALRSSAWPRQFDAVFVDHCCTARELRFGAPCRLAALASRARLPLTFTLAL